MASKAIAKAKPEWSKVTSRIHQSELPTLNKFKSQVDACLTKVASLPDSLPKIDWDHYRKHASNPKMVDELERKYATLSFETPKAPAARMEALRRARQQDEARLKKFVDLANSFIESADVVKKKFEKMIPPREMNREDWALTFPNWSHNYENPSIAPHYGRGPGLSREEAAALDQPDPVPFATKTAWKDWEKRKKFYD